MLFPAHFPHSKPRYALWWSRTVVKRFEESCPRASEFAHEFLGSCTEDWALLLSYADPLWPKIRSMAQIMENWMNCANWPGWTPGMKSSLRRTLNVRMPQTVLEQLDSVGICVKLREQGKARESTAEPPAAPVSFSREFIFLPGADDGRE
jgi:hypothetical protein